MSVSDFFPNVGNTIAGWTAQVIAYLTSLNVIVSESTAKVISLLIFTILLFVVVRFVSLARKPLKYLIIILLAILIVSIGWSFFV